MVLAPKAQSRPLTLSTTSDNLEPITERPGANSVVKKLHRIKTLTSLGARRQDGGIAAIARSTIILYLSGHLSLACTATGVSEDINTTAVYTSVLFKKKEWLHNGTDKVVCFQDSYLVDNPNCEPCRSGVMDPEIAT